MRSSELFWFTALVVVMLGSSGCPKGNVVCEDGKAQECFCPDGTQKIQSCMADSMEGHEVISEGPGHLHVPGVFASLHP